jgi:hypothetical protein
MNPASLSQELISEKVNGSPSSVFTSMFTAKSQELRLRERSIAESRGIIWNEEFREAFVGKTAGHCTGVTR